MVMQVAVADGHLEERHEFRVAIVDLFDELASISNATLAWSVTRSSGRPGRSWP
jgi:hypothetical protein